MFFRGLPQPLIPASCIRYMDEVKLADPNTKILMLRNLLKERIPGKFLFSFRKTLFDLWRQIETNWKRLLPIHDVIKTFFVDFWRYGNVFFVDLWRHAYNYDVMNQ